MNEKITISAEFSKTEVAAALLCLGIELDDNLWNQIASRQPLPVNWEQISDKADKLQAKLGLIAIAVGSAFPHL